MEQIKEQIYTIIEQMTGVDKGGVSINLLNLNKQQNDNLIYCFVPGLNVKINFMIDKPEIKIMSDRGSRTLYLDETEGYEPIDVMCYLISEEAPNDKPYTNLLSGKYKHDRLVLEDKLALDNRTYSVIEKFDYRFGLLRRKVLNKLNLELKYLLYPMTERDWESRKLELI